MKALFKQCFLSNIFYYDMRMTNYCSPKPELILFNKITHERKQVYYQLLLVILSRILFLYHVFHVFNACIPDESYQIDPSCFSLEIVIVR